MGCFAYLYGSVKVGKPKRYDVKELKEFKDRNLIDASLYTYLCIAVVEPLVYFAFLFFYETWHKDLLLQ